MAIGFDAGRWDESERGSGYLPTGNELVSLPTLRAADAGIERLGLLHMGSASVIELCGSEAGADPADGEPLFAPLLRVDGAERPLRGALHWGRLAHFVPRFVWGSPGQGIHLEGAVWGPVGEKGFVYLLRVHNPGSASGTARIELGLRGSWCETLQRVESSARIEAVHRVRIDSRTGAPVFEARPGTAMVGFAPVPSAPLDLCRCEHGGALQGQEFSVEAGQPIGFELAKRFEVAPGGWAELAFFVGVSRDGDGARACALDLARQGWQQLLDRTLEWLDRRRLSLSRLDGEERERLEAIANLNLFFNYFFSLGRCVDTEALAMVASRSPLYPASGAFFARDALLWSLPAVTAVEPATAREMLAIAFTRHLVHAGCHGLYLDGGRLYPGFALDELCAYVVGLNHYVATTGDETLVREPFVAHGLRHLESRLFARRHVGAWLFETTLSPGGAVPRRRCLTSANALVALAFDALQSLSDRGLHGVPQSGADARAWRELAARVREAVRANLVADGPFGPMFAWSGDPDCGEAGERELSEEPQGSLSLLAHWKLCPPDDPTLRNTLRWIHSDQNPRAALGGRIEGVSCRAGGEPSALGIANDLLAGRTEEARRALLEAPLDGGLACEAFDRQTGRASSGPAFASAAGWLAWAVARAFS